jgi:hypothetical protein
MHIRHILSLVGLLVAASTSNGALKINEVHYNVAPLPQGGNQFIEL